MALWNIWDYSVLYHKWAVVIVLKQQTFMFSYFLRLSLSDDTVEIINGAQFKTQSFAALVTSLHAPLKISVCCSIVPCFFKIIGIDCILKYFVSCSSLPVVLLSTNTVYLIRNWYVICACTFFGFDHIYVHFCWLLKVVLLHACCYPRYAWRPVVLVLLLDFSLNRFKALLLNMRNG